MKLITLTRGLCAKVDDEDFDELQKYKWYAVKCAKKYYARRTEGGKKIYMHRHLAGYPPRLFVDHKDGDSLNNQKENLRNCNQSENMANRSGYDEAKYKGVYVENTKYRVRIGYQGKLLNVGLFETEIQAALAYDRKAEELFGDFAETNFPF
jgi:hypothetical protein